MTAQEMIERYVHAVARQLPARQRDGVAAELRALLTEDLKERAAGREADAALAGALLLEFGRPAEVAARYAPSFAIIEPADTRNFIRAGVITTCILALLGGLGLLLRPTDGPGLGHWAEWTAGKSLLVLGVLVLVFGFTGWMRRRSPARTWDPKGLPPADSNKTSRFGLLMILLAMIFGFALYGAPEWTFAQITGRPELPAWLAFDETFRRERLPWLFVLWIVHGAVFATAAVQGRWRRATRLADILMGVVGCGLMVWFLRAGPMFEARPTDGMAKAIIGLVVFILLIEVVVKTYRQAIRVYPAEVAGAR